MIDLYSGTPGSGKSLHAAIAIKWALKTGKPVICNFSINTEKIKRIRGTFTEVNNWDITPEYLIRFSQEYFNGKMVKEDAILLVLDECQLLFNARDWAKQGRNKWLSFFTQHRKFGYRIILIAQYDMMIDKQIRSLIEYEYVHRKLSNYGWRGKILSLAFGGHAFISVRIWYPMNLKVDSDIFRARKSIFQLYNTYSQLDKPPEQETKKIESSPLSHSSRSASTKGA